MNKRSNGFKRANQIFKISILIFSALLDVPFIRNIILFCRAKKSEMLSETRDLKIILTRNA